jgi:hypothetical protein
MRLAKYVITGGRTGRLRRGAVSSQTMQFDEVRVKPLDTLETDVPTTAADNEALWRARQLDSMEPHEYLQFLLKLTRDLPPDRHITAGEPFEL